MSGGRGGLAGAAATAAASGVFLFLLGALSGYLLSSAATQDRDGRPSTRKSADAEPSEEDQMTTGRRTTAEGGGGGSKDMSGGEVNKAGKGGGDGSGGRLRPILMVVQRCRHARLLLHAANDDANGAVIGDGGGAPSSQAPAASIATVGRRVDIGSPLPSSPSSCGDATTVPVLPVGGMVVYVSFAKTAKSGPMVTDAARTLLNLPILTRGRWGDGAGGGTVMSALRMAAELDSERRRRRGGGGGGAEVPPPPGTTTNEMGEEEGVAIVVVPQANLISKVKSGGKSVQYHDQIDKGDGAKLFDEFVDALTSLSLRHQLATRGGADGEAGYTKSKTAGGERHQSNASSSTTASSVPPEHLLRDESKYSSWDDDGFPLTDVDGNPLTKSARKKLRKIHDAHRKRHAKYLLKQQRAKRGDDGDSPADPTRAPAVEPKDHGEEAEEPKQRLDPGFITIVRGTFGRRQGLEFCSDMGPFCHVLGVG